MIPTLHLRYVFLFCLVLFLCDPAAGLCLKGIICQLSFVGNRFKRKSSSVQSIFASGGGRFFFSSSFFFFNRTFWPDDVTFNCYARQFVELVAANQKWNT